MTTLTRLIQDEHGWMYVREGVFHRHVDSRNVSHAGKIRTVVFENPVDVEEAMNKYVKDYPASIPKLANSYVISDFNGGTQKVVKDDKDKEHVLSVYALQFYFAGL